MAITVCLCMLALIFQVTTGVTRPNSTEDLTIKLQKRVRDYTLSNTNFVGALTRVASEFQIPLGITWFDAPAARAPLTLSWKNATVREVIEAIVETQPHYELRVANGVVHVSARNRIPDRQNFLSLNIKTFQVENVPVEFAERKLRNQIKSSISLPKKGLGGGGIAGSGFSKEGDPRITVGIAGSNVEGILDRIAVASARKIWIVTFSEDPKLTATGFRRTLSLWSKSSVAEDDQPLWDTFHWGDPIPYFFQQKSQ